MTDYLQAPHFSNVDVSGKFKFMPALTDGGICQVLNGKPMRTTYASSERADIFKKLLDGRMEKAVPNMIRGSGVMFKKTFWLDVGERYYYE